MTEKISKELRSKKKLTNSNQLFRQHRLKKYIESKVKKKYKNVCEVRFKKKVCQKNVKAPQIVGLLVESEVSA